MAGKAQEYAARSGRKFLDMNVTITAVLRAALRLTDPSTLYRVSLEESEEYGGGACWRDLWKAVAPDLVLGPVSPPSVHSVSEEYECIGQIPSFYTCHVAEVGLGCFRPNRSPRVGEALHFSPYGNHMSGFRSGAVSVSQVAGSAVRFDTTLSEAVPGVEPNDYIYVRKTAPVELRHNPELDAHVACPPPEQAKCQLCGETATRRRCDAHAHTTPLEQRQVELALKDERFKQSRHETRAHQLADKCGSLEGELSAVRTAWEKEKQGRLDAEAEVRLLKRKLAESKSRR